MYNSNLENQLIAPEIKDLMTDYVSIQLDIDDQKIKAAAMVAQTIDLTKIIGKVNLSRVIQIDQETASEADWTLRELLIAPWCYYTYARCLMMFQGILTDSGYAVETEVESRHAAKSASSEMRSIGDSFMQAAIDFLQLENPSTSVTNKDITPRVRVFGGQENRSSN